jgi:hypothetical protein
MTHGTDQKNPGKIASMFNTVIANPGMAMLVVFGIIILIAVYKGAPVLDKLSEPNFARGLITFIICLATIGLAFMLVCYAFSESSDERFKRAREVFAGLLGILGTIVGFYFGSATTAMAPIGLADIQINDREVVTYVTGGAPPYQGKITATGTFDDSSAIKPPKEPTIVSQNGWITYTFEKPLSKATIEIDIKDSQNRTASKEREYVKQKLEKEPAGKANP